METTGRLLVLAVALVLALTGCTGGDEPNAGSTGASGGTAGTGATAPSGPTGTISVPPGSSVYRYVNAGLQAVLDLDTDTLEIRNETGSDLARPGFYVLDARDGTQIDGQVVDPAAVPAGETATFDVTLDGIELRNIGLVVLLMGPDNLGAFVQQ
ncbi:MAG TPA: hypothetical protein VLE71_07385 [Actinomycetota bacterium]|nr:hypothetical protein [Actinomycetota bacterium]